MSEAKCSSLVVTTEVTLSLVINFPQATDPLDLTAVPSLHKLTIRWSFLPEEVIVMTKGAAAAIVKYLGTLTLTPCANSHLRKIIPFFGGRDYYTTITATEKRCKVLAVSTLQAVLTELVDAFPLDGIYFKCCPTFNAGESGRDLIQDIFPSLSRDNSMIFESDWYDISEGLYIL